MFRAGPRVLAYPRRGVPVSAAQGSAGPPFLAFGVMSMEERPVRLVLVDLSHRVGLAERSVWELATRLPRERYTVQVWLSAGEHADALVEALEAHELRVERFDEPASRWDWKTPFHLWLRLRREHPQIVHVHDAGAAGSMRVARSAVADGVPLVITRHAAGAPGSDPEVRKVFARADVVSCTTRADTQELVDEWGLSRERVRWIPYGTNIPDFDAERAPARAWRDQLGARALRPLWVCPLRLEPGRGHEPLLEALGMVRARSLEFIAVFAADGALRPELERRVQVLGLDRHVQFVAEQAMSMHSRDPLGPLLAAPDAVVIPALDGPLPLSLLGAMARARPVVAGALPAISDVIEDGVHGRLVPPGEATALAETLEAFHRRPDAALRLGRAAAEHVHNAFAWDRVVDRFEDAYDEILGLASFIPESAHPAPR